MNASTRALQEDLASRLDGLRLAADDRARVDLAVRASFAVHDGSFRPGGVPYPDHPLSVALRMLASGAARTSSHVVAALLHDAVEDAPGALVSFLRGSPAGDATPDAAYRALAEIVDPRAAEWIRHLTNPDFDAAVAHLPGPGRAEAKRALYCEHVVGLVDHAPEAFLVKFEDFSENALSLHAVEDGPLRQKLRAKYGPVVKGLIARLQRLEDPTHPAMPHRARMLEALGRAWEAEYAGMTDRP
ncbi:MAG: hypothetical protein RL653_2054 [Pseudomonadota bacterium]|jgi:hypothetical protein